MVYALCFLPNVRRSGTRDIRYYAIRKLLEGPAIMWSRMFVINVSIHKIKMLNYTENQKKKSQISNQVDFIVGNNERCQVQITETFW